MPVRFSDICDFLHRIVPEELAEPWDNGGIQINVSDTPLTAALVSLEITNKVIDEAIAAHAGAIITHHPLRFSPIKNVDHNNIIGNYICRLIRNDISVYAAHTSFDSVWGGINDDLAGRIGLSAILSLSGSADARTGGLGRKGRFEPPRSLSTIAEAVRESLRISGPIRLIGDPDRLIEHVAVSAGAGVDAFEEPGFDGCELLITGDIRYHQAQKASETGIALIDAGHYQTERIFVPNMAGKLREEFAGLLEIIETTVDQDPFRVL